MAITSRKPFAWLLQHTLSELHKLSPYSSKTAVTATTAVYSTIIAYVVRVAQVVSLFLKDGCDRNNCRLYESDVLFQYMTNRYAHHRQPIRMLTPDIKKRRGRHFCPSRLETLSFRKSRSSQNDLLANTLTPLACTDAKLVDVRVANLVSVLEVETVKVVCVVLHVVRNLSHIILRIW